MLPWDPTGKIGPKRPLPDNVTVTEPKEDRVITEPISEDKTVPQQQQQQQQQQQPQQQQSYTPQTGSA
jgi:small subunit ribosomal protein S3e